MAWTCTIERVDNGYKIKYEGENGPSWHVIQEDEVDGLKDHEELLFWLMDYFNFGGSKHDPERLRIKREQSDG